MCKLMEEYEKRTLNRFMKKLTVPGEKCNLKMRMNLRADTSNASLMESSNVLVVQ